MKRMKKVSFILFILSFTASTWAWDCRIRISEIICLVQYEQGDSLGNMSRPCLPRGDKYAHFFENIYDNYPSALQKMFCSLDIIFIEKDFFATGYARLIRDESNQFIGAKLGVKKSVLDQNLNLTLWSTWKDQLNFGANPYKHEINPELPIVTTSSPDEVNDFLYFLVAHEFAHMLDYTNNINRERCYSEPRFCPLKMDGWSKFSWKNEYTIKSEFDFTGSSSLCFYWCNGNHIPVEKITDVYQGLDNSNFISLYATSNPDEDFADTFAYYIMDKYLSSSYLIDTKQNYFLDIMERLHSPELTEKYNFIDYFLNYAEIRYPKDNS